jgi:hypothetical protein
MVDEWLNLCPKEQERADFQQTLVNVSNRRRPRNRLNKNMKNAGETKKLDCEISFLGEFR